MLNLSVTATVENGQPVLHLHGELDVAGTTILRSHALRTLETNGHHNVVLDMSDVTFLDSSGLGVLIEIRNHARAHGTDLTLRAVPPVAYRVIELAGLTAAFGLTTTP